MSVPRVCRKPAVSRRLRGGGDTMSWTDHYQRRDAINLVLAQAERTPETGLAFDELPEVQAAFDSRAELALALQYKWSQLLTGRIAVALDDARHSPDVDQVEAVATAWRTAAGQAPALRRLLDDYAHDADGEFQVTQRAEQRMLALAAGLAEIDETGD